METRVVVWSATRSWRRTSGRGSTASSDVQLCPDSLVAQAPMYRALAARLPRPAVWGCTPLSRTRRTAEAIFAAGYPAQELFVEPD